MSEPFTIVEIIVFCYRCTNQIIIENTTFNGIVDIIKHYSLLGCEKIRLKIRKTRINNAIEEEIVEFVDIIL